MPLRPVLVSVQSVRCPRLLRLAPLLSIPLRLHPARPLSSPTSPPVCQRQTPLHGKARLRPPPSSLVQKLIRTSSPVASRYLAHHALSSSRDNRRRASSTILTPTPYPSVVQWNRRLFPTPAAPIPLAILLQLRLLTVTHRPTSVSSIIARMIPCVSLSWQDRPLESWWYPNPLVMSSRPLRRRPMHRP